MWMHFPKILCDEMRGESCPSMKKNCAESWKVTGFKLRGLVDTSRVSCMRACQFGKAVKDIQSRADRPLYLSWQGLFAGVGLRGEILKRIGATGRCLLLSSFMWLKAVAGKADLA
jgi:hypothetical protein